LPSGFDIDCKIPASPAFFTQNTLHLWTRARPAQSTLTFAARPQISLNLPPTPIPELSLNYLLLNSLVGGRFSEMGALFVAGSELQPLPNVHAYNRRPREHGDYQDDCEDHDGTDGAFAPHALSIAAICFLALVGVLQTVLLKCRVLR